MASEFTLYYGPLSQPSRSILLLLKVIGASHKVHLVNLLEGEHMKPEFIKVNPFHTVPVLVHGDFTLTESKAIARYVLNTHKSDDHWYPSDPKKRARVDEYLGYEPGNTRKAGVDIIVNILFKPMQTRKPITEEKIKEVMGNLDKVLTGFEEYFLKDRPFIAGEEISIADIFAVSEIRQPEMSGIDYLSSHPKVSQWMDRVRVATQPHFDEVFQEFGDFTTGDWRARLNIP